MSGYQVNWTVDQTQIGGIPEPPAPKNPGAGGSVAEIILQGFMAIINYFNKNVLDPDSRTLQAMRKITDDLNQLKNLLNEVTASGGDLSQFGTQITGIMSNLSTLIGQIPDGLLKEQLQTALQGVTKFFQSPLAQQVVNYIQDLQNFQKIWNELLTWTSMPDSLVKDFSNALGALDGDRKALEQIVSKLDPKLDGTVYTAFNDLKNQFEQFWHMLMRISAGNQMIHKSLDDVWPSGDFWESFKDWVKGFMVAQGKLHEWDDWWYTCHNFDAFQDGHYLDNMITAFQNAQNGQPPINPQDLGELLHQMAQDTNPWDSNSLFNELSGVWSGFQTAVTDVSQAISSAESINQQFVTQVNADLTEYKAIVQLFTDEIEIPQHEVDLSISRLQK